MSSSCVCNKLLFTIRSCLWSLNVVHTYGNNPQFWRHVNNDDTKLQLNGLTVGRQRLHSFYMMEAFLHTNCPILFKFQYRSLNNINNSKFMLCNGEQQIIIKKGDISKHWELVMLLVNASKHLSCEKATIFLLKNYVFLPLSFAPSKFIPFSFLIKSIILSQTSSHDC